MSTPPSYIGHIAHQGMSELTHWRPDPDWSSPIICGTTARLSKLILGRLNRISFEGKGRWDKLFSSDAIAQRRLEGSGLLSFSNHVSLFDDPLLIANLGETKFERTRWIAADHINFFGNRLKGIIFSGGKCVPIIRGAGLKQPGFDYLVQRLKCGDWVHIFPEGGRSRELDHSLQLPLKLGVGKLIYEANPTVLPFYHYGMQNVLPIGKVFPKLNQLVKVRFGEAVTTSEEWWTSLIGPRKIEPQQAWVLATEWVRDELLKLEHCVHPKFSSS